VRILTIKNNALKKAIEGKFSFDETIFDEYFENKNKSKSKIKINQI
jgi:hypothetical protein